MEVIPGVHLIETYANTFLMTDQRMVLIDASSEKEPAKIKDALARSKTKPGDITSILVTHTHPDHVTGLAWLRKLAPNAKVAAHEVEAPFIAKERNYDGPPPSHAHEAVKVDVRLKDGGTVDGFTVIHTPGHTLGSMSLHDAGKRLLVAGDAVKTDGGLSPMPDQYNRDPKLHRQSIKKLAQFDFETLVCGHGPPIAKGAGAQVKSLAKSL